MSARKHVRTSRLSVVPAHPSAAPRAALYLALATALSVLSMPALAAEVCDTSGDAALAASADGAMALACGEGAEASGALAAAVGALSQADGTGATALGGVARQPRYLIELLPDMSPPLGNSVGAELKGTPFRITALGFGKQANTRVMLQSTFYKP